MAINNAVNATVTGFQSLNATTGVWNGRTLQPGTGISITNGDGTGGDPTISATNSPPDSAFGTLVIVDDFVYNDPSLSNNLCGDTNWTVTAASFARKAGEANHPGIVSNTTAGGLLQKSSNGSDSIPLGAGTVTVDFIIRVVTTGAVDIYIGLTDSTLPNAEPANGCYFLYNSGTNSGNWVGKTANGGTRSSANSANAVVAGNWVRLTIVVNAAGTSVAYFVNNVQITNSPLTTNIPAVSLAPSVRCRNGATVGVDVDLITLKYVLAVSR